MKLESYVGRIVRLNANAFQALLKRVRRAKSGGAGLENCFIVATISREMRTLICYGADIRITVGIADVVLV